MKTKLFLSILFTAFIYQSSIAQKTGKIEMPAYPSYKEVVNQFFTQYTAKNDNPEFIFSLTKKPDGWHARFTHYLTNDVIQDKLYWSRKTKDYLEIDFPHYVQAEIDPKHNNMLGDDHYITMSKLVPYWGYDGWEMDVIKEFAGKNNLSDDLLNAVGRAYSSYARGFTDYNEFGNPENFKKLPKGQNALSPEILAKYLENQHLSIKYYYKLYKQNPKYETFVSDIYDVYSNEIMNCFLTLRYFQNEETAQKELKKELYSPFYIEMAKNYLNSCDSNAILFTNGDMDTYPLLYVQEIENFRKDVLVVNLSLLNLGRYICHLANFKAGAKPLKLKIDSEIYKSESKSFVYIQDNLERPAKIEDIFEFVVSTDASTKILLEDQSYDYIPTTDLYFIIDRDKIKKEYKEEMFRVDSSFNIHLSGNYLYISNLCVLDIIATNNFERPIYFASTVSNDNYSVVEKYLSFEAYALKITPLIFSNIDNYYKIKVFSDILNNKVFNKLKFDKKNYNSLGASQKRMIGNYRLIFTMLADQLIEEKKNEKALQVLDYCINLFPNEVSEYDYFIIDFIRNYFKIKQVNKAKNLIETCMKAVINKIESLQKEKEDEDIKQNLMIKVYTLNELHKVSAEFIPNDQITFDLQAEFEKYKDLVN